MATCKDERATGHARPKSGMSSIMAVQSEFEERIKEPSIATVVNNLLSCRRIFLTVKHRNCPTKLDSHSQRESLHTERTDGVISTKVGNYIILKHYNLLRFLLLEKEPPVLIG
jgi:hypothetical protein